MKNFDKDVSLWSRCIIETICSDTLPSVYTASNPILLYIRVFTGFSGSTMLILGQTCINQRRHRNKSTEKVTLVDSGFLDLLVCWGKLLQLDQENSLT